MTRQTTIIRVRAAWSLASFAVALVTGRLLGKVAMRVLR
jgi:hypothetical protein